MRQDSGSSKSWFIQTCQGTNGPFTASQLQRLAASGKLTRDDLVRREDSENWRAAGQVKGLHFGGTSESALEQPPVPSAQQAQPAVAITPVYVATMVAESQAPVPRKKVWFKKVSAAAVAALLLLMGLAIGIWSLNSSKEAASFATDNSSDAQEFLQEAQRIAVSSTLKPVDRAVELSQIVKHLKLCGLQGQAQQTYVECKRQFALLNAEERKAASTRVAENLADADLIDDARHIVSLAGRPNAAPGRLVIAVARRGDANAAVSLLMNSDDRSLYKQAINAMTLCAAAQEADKNLITEAGFRLLLDKTKEAAEQISIVNDRADRYEEIAVALLRSRFYDSTPGSKDNSTIDGITKLFDTTKLDRSRADYHFSNTFYWIARRRAIEGQHHKALAMADRAGSGAFYQTALLIGVAHELAAVGKSAEVEAILQKCPQFAYEALHGETGVVTFGRHDALILGYYSLANARLEAGDRQAAKRYVLKALELIESNIDFQRRQVMRSCLAVALARAGDADHATAMCENMKSSVNRQARQQIAIVHAMCGRVEQAQTLALEGETPSERIGNLCSLAIASACLDRAGYPNPYEFEWRSLKRNFVSYLLQ